MKTIIVWFRNDLRVHDHPALHLAAKEADYVVPVFILNKDILNGRHAGSNRNRFLVECLQDLKTSLKKIGADLVIREGDALSQLKKLAKDVKAKAVYYTSDYTSYAIQRDKKVKSELKKSGIAFKSLPGRLIVNSPDLLKTKAGQPHKVFTPFHKNWQQIKRRKMVGKPQKLKMPKNLPIGSIPSINELTKKTDLSPKVLQGGETEARKRLKSFLQTDINKYSENHNDMGEDSTSRLSSYLHFGCLSPLEIENMLPPNGKSVYAWHRQLAWRDFYHYIIFNNPKNATQEFQEKYRKLKWQKNTKLLKAWQQGQTGYPAVDAAMRQLNTKGWMHNRGRLIVGSFLTKDLGLDWREGESYFMRMLIDGDEANNNGNWQWIAGVGVDPAPVYRRLYNPTLQRDKFDPNGKYVRKYIKELGKVPDKYLSEPWTMPEDVQNKAGCIIGKDYPGPIVNHAEARQAALERYKQV